MIYQRAVITVAIAINVSNEVPIYWHCCGTSGNLGTGGGGLCLETVGRVIKMALWGGIAILIGIPLHKVNVDWK